MSDTKRHFEQALSEKIRAIFAEKTGATADEVEMAVADFWRLMDGARQQYYARIDWSHRPDTDDAVTEVRARGFDSDFQNMVAEIYTGSWRDSDERHIWDAIEEEFLGWLAIDMRLSPDGVTSLSDNSNENLVLGRCTPEARKMLEHAARLEKLLNTEQPPDEYATVAEAHLREHPYCVQCSINGKGTHAVTVKRVERLRGRFWRHDRLVTESLCNECWIEHLMSSG